MTKDDTGYGLDEVTQQLTRSSTRTSTPTPPLTLTPTPNPTPTPTPDQVARQLLLLEDSIDLGDVKSSWGTKRAAWIKRAGAMVDQDPKATPPKQDEPKAAHATYKGQVLALTLTPTLTLTIPSTPTLTLTPTLTPYP